MHRPCASPGTIDHGCDSAAYGRTGDTREHPGCECTASRAHVPAFTASPTHTAGAPAPPQPTPTAQAVNDTSTPSHTTGVSTHSTPDQYVERHREYIGVLGCAFIGGVLQARTRQAIAQRTLMAPVRCCSSKRRTRPQRRQVGPVRPLPQVDKRDRPDFGLRCALPWIDMCGHA